MPVDEAPRLPTTQLPTDELEGELGGHSLQLVKEINAFAAAHVELRSDFDENEATDASEGQLAEVATQLDVRIDEVADGANAAMISAVSALAVEIAADLAEASVETSGLVAAVDAALRDEIVEVADDANAALVSEVATLNDRVGRPFEVSTPDATPVTLATLTPSPFRSVRIEARIVAHRANRLEAAAYHVLALARAVPSSDVLTLSVGVPSDGETVVLDAVTYTWRATPTVANDVDIGGTIEGSIDNLVAAINLTGTAGVEYGAGTVKHPTVSAEKASTTTMDAVARIPGVAGDAIVATETMTNGAWAGGGTLINGTDMSLFGSAVTTDYEDDAAWDVAVIATGTDVEIDVTGVADTVVDWLAEVRTTELI